MKTTEQKLIEKLEEKVISLPLTGERGELLEILWKHATNMRGDETYIPISEMDSIVDDILALRKSQDTTVKGAEITKDNIAKTESDTLKQPDQKLFKKVYIKTEADLPEEDGEYFVITKAKNYFDVYNFNKEFSNVWLNHITAYLLPIKQVIITNEEIDEEACRLSERTDSNGKTFIDAEYYDGFNDGAKWRRDKLNNE